MEDVDWRNSMAVPGVEKFTTETQREGEEGDLGVRDTAAKNRAPDSLLFSFS
jgi:hypothetical protein